MKDRYNREINYLRVSVTDRCNLRCRYCMPEEGIPNLGHDSILSLEEIARLIQVGTRVGIRKIRLTGGEPLVRRNLVRLVEYISAMPEINDIAITTNGVLFARQAENLKKAGLTRANFSLDSLNPDRFRYITRVGNVEDVKKAIFKAIELEMHPVKLNMVVVRGFNDDEVLDFAELARQYPLHVRFIEFMPIGDLVFWEGDRLVSSADIKSRIEQEYELEPGRSVAGNGPAKYYLVRGGKGSLGFISPMSNHFCAECNRIRMTADGRLRGCLHDRREIDLKAPLRRGADDEELLNLFSQAIAMKPAQHRMNDGWGLENERKMYQIGG
jgi:cyclic pyranopterin phosphate synthase